MSSANLEFVAENGVVVGGNGHIRVAWGNTAQRPADSGIGSFRYNTDIGTFEGYGANGYGPIGGGANSVTAFFSNNVWVGNATVNVAVNSTQVSIGANQYANGSAYFVGNSTQFAVMNSFQFSVGAWLANGSGWGVGNSTVSVTANSTAIVINGTVINSTSYGGSVAVAGSANAVTGLPPMTSNVDWWNSSASKVAVTDRLQLAMQYVTLTDATTIAVDCNTGINFTVTLGGNRLLGNMTNKVIGRSGIIEVVEDATGSRTLSLSSDYKTDSGAGLTLNTSAGRINGIMYHIRGANAVWLSIPFKGVS